MGISHVNKHADAVSNGEGESGFEKPASYDAVHGSGQHHVDAHHSLHRGLKARHISMIAIGGAIGTGLIIGT